MSFLRAFLIKRLSLPILDDAYPDWHRDYTTAQLWRWYEQTQERP
jgi:hypothetical protein